MPTTTATTPIEQRKEQLAEQLQAEAPNLTSADRMKIAVKLGCRERGVNDYLKGDVKKIPFAEALLQTIRARAF